MVLKLSSYVDLKAGILMHPAHSMMAMLLGLNEEDLYKDVKCPQMFIPAKDDHENTKLGGLVTNFTNLTRVSKKQDRFSFKKFVNGSSFLNTQCYKIGW